jgi:hypothetical protein
MNGIIGIISSVYKDRKYIFRRSNYPMPRERTQQCSAPHGSPESYRLPNTDFNTTLGDRHAIRMNLHPFRKKKRMNLHPHVDFSNHAAPLLSNEGHGLFAETPPAARPEQTKTTGTLHNEQRRRFCPHEPAFCSGRSPGLARDRRHEQDRIQ